MENYTFPDDTSHKIRKRNENKWKYCNQCNNLIKKDEKKTVSNSHVLFFIISYFRALSHSC